MESYFEAKVAYHDEETQKQVRRNFLIDAMTFTEAEANATIYMTEYLDSQLFEIQSLKRVGFTELVFRPEDEGAEWYEAKVKEELDGKEVVTKYLVSDYSVKQATQQLLQHLNDSQYPPTIKSVSERGIYDIIIRKECCKECDVCDSTHRILSFEEQRSIELSFEELDKRNQQLLEEFGATEIRGNRFVIEATEENLNQHKGKVLGRRVVRTWKEDFVDESSGDVISIDRTEVVLDRGVVLDEESIQAILESGAKEVEIRSSAILRI